MGFDVGGFVSDLVGPGIALGGLATGNPIMIGGGLGLSGSRLKSKAKGQQEYNPPKPVYKTIRAKMPDGSYLDIPILQNRHEMTTYRPPPVQNDANLDFLGDLLGVGGDLLALGSLQGKKKPDPGEWV